MVLSFCTDLSIPDDDRSHEWDPLRGGGFISGSPH